MSAFETIKAAYTAFGRNDPSVLFGAMDSAINWNEAELLAAIDNFTAVPTTFIDGGDHVVVLGRYGGTMKAGGATLDSPFCHVYRFREGKAVTVEVSKLAREGRFDYLLVESTGLSEPLPGAEPRLGRRTVLTFPLLPPPQKN
jgi:uncharacterized protein